MKPSQFTVAPINIKTQMGDNFCQFIRFANNMGELKQLLM